GAGRLSGYRSDRYNAGSDRELCRSVPFFGHWLFLCQEQRKRGRCEMAGAQKKTGGPGFPSDRGGARTSGNEEETGREHAREGRAERRRRRLQPCREEWKDC